MSHVHVFKGTEGAPLEWWSDRHSLPFGRPPFGLQLSRGRGLATLIGGRQSTNSFHFGI
jgi:hypothetical protein